MNLTPRTCGWYTQSTKHTIRIYLNYAVDYSQIAEAFRSLMAFDNNQIKSLYRPAWRRLNLMLILYRHAPLSTHRYHHYGSRIHLFHISGWDALKRCDLWYTLMPSKYFEKSETVCKLQATARFNPLAQMLDSLFHSFEAGIANAISSFKWRKIFIFKKNISNIEL